MKWIKILDNYSIKRKLIVMYLLCVFIPLILTNLIIFNNIVSSTNNERKQVMSSICQKVKYNINTVLEESISVSEQFYTSRILDDYVSREYEDAMEFYDQYYYLLSNSILKCYYKSKPEYNIKIYADNETIINSGEVVKLTEDIRSHSWYQEFCDNNRSLTVIADYDDEEYRYHPAIKGFRKISLIKGLNYFSNDKEKVLKVDIDYNSILNNILNEEIDADIYVCNDKYILFSNKNQDINWQKYESIDAIEVKDILIADNLKVNGTNEEWKIVVSADKLSFNKILNISGTKEKIWLFILITLLLPSSIILLISYSVTRRLSIINKHIEKIEGEKFCTIDNEMGNDEVGKLIRSYNIMVIKIRELIEVVLRKNIEQQNLELAKSRAELKALQSQVNPHFMFNTLETIRMRSLIKEESETAEIIEKLSKLLRETIVWGDDCIYINDELMFVENYIKIQQYRFGEKISLDLNVKPDCYDIKVPKLSIVTFVENSCVHGVEAVTRNCYISINVYKNDNKLIIEIEDNGGGIQLKRLTELRRKISNMNLEQFDSEKSIGILNSYMRLYKWFGNNMTFKIYSVEKVGTQIRIEVDELKGGSND